MFNNQLSAPDASMQVSAAHCRRQEMPCGHLRTLYPQSFAYYHSRMTNYRREASVCAPSVRIPLYCSAELTRSVRLHPFADTHAY